VREVEVIEDREAAVVALDSMRARLLAELVEPASEATLSARVGLSRQKVNYHLNALEAHGLVAVVDRRKWGGITERVLQATAASYIVSPRAVDAGADDPQRVADRLSARYVVALAARMIRDVASLARRADAEGKRLPTLTIDTEIGFRSAEDRAAFASELTDAIASLAARYHHDDGRPHRLVATSYPRPEEPS
jgi:DNA-binding transcriptional ArsR family regulator